MDLIGKIEKIRQKPEHIRVRYVWFCVAVSMIFVLTIWIFSMKSQLQQIPDTGIPTQDIGVTIDQFNQQKDSLKNFVNNTDNAAENSGTSNFPDAGQGQ